MSPILLCSDRLVHTLGSQPFLRRSSCILVDVHLYFLGDDVERVLILGLLCVLLIQSPGGFGKLRHTWSLRGIAVEVQHLLYFGSKR